METSLKLPLADDTLKELVDQARDFALSHGVMLRSRDGQSDYHAPITLLPSPVPRECLEKAYQVQTVFNLLMHRVAHDHQFLASSLESTIQVDDFTRNLWKIYLRVREEGPAQPLSLGLNRSDYMTCTEVKDGSMSHGEVKDGSRSYGIKQVEFNTMASGAGSLSQELCKWHKYVFDVVGESARASQVADNRASDGLAQAIIKAWTIYDRPDAVVLFLVLEGETNIYDQRLLEYSIRQHNARCRVKRTTLRDIQTRAKLGHNKELLVDDTEVAIVYQRSCYNPSHFRNEQDWQTRLLIERSLAIKCPSIHYHLAGTKKVQQVLAQPGVLERFVDNPQDGALVRSTQTGLYSLALDADGDRNAQMAISSPHKFVLKPQREGGGNNVFGQEIATTLKSLRDSQDRTAYILMDRLRPLQFENYIVKHGHDVTVQTLISEIGIFGSFIGCADSVRHNAVHGYLFRTKTSDTNEGGLMSGTAALDTIYLI